MFVSGMSIVIESHTLLTVEAQYLVNRFCSLFIHSKVIQAFICQAQ